MSLVARARTMTALAALLACLALHGGSRYVMGQALLAADREAPSGTYAESLTPSDVGSAMLAVRARLRDAGLSSQELRTLESISIELTDLPGATLGGADGHSIRLDATAAGWGWFVDLTPNDDAEFAGHNATGGAAGRIDLLTTLAHEMLHVLGRADLDAALYPRDVMAASLPRGVRRLQTAAMSLATGGGPMLSVTAPGFTLPPGRSVTITIDATIAQPLPPGVGQVSLQASISADTLGTILSDDPATAAGSDATVTRVVRPAVTGTPIDFDNDGTGDTFLYNPITGSWAFNLGGGGAGAASTWDAGWTVVPARLNDDAYTDIFLYHPARGLWVQARNNAGDGTFSYTVGNWDHDWTVYPADLNGDGLTDLFVYNAVTGVWVKCFVDGQGEFAAYTGGQWDPGWAITTADFNADGRDDFFVYNPGTGVWVKILSQAGFGAFDYPLSGQWDLGWEIHAGDFDGDGRTDLFLYDSAGLHHAPGVHVTAMSRADSDFNYVVGQWDAGWTIARGDLNNDGRTDLFLYNRTTGVWVEAFSAGDGDFWYLSGQWDPGWTIRMTDFTNDSRADVLVSRPDGTFVRALNVADGVFLETPGNWGTGWIPFTQ